MEQYITSLYSLAEGCEFGDTKDTRFVITWPSVSGTSCCLNDSNGVRFRPGQREENDSPAGSSPEAINNTQEPTRAPLSKSSWKIASHGGQEKQYQRAKCGPSKKPLEVQGFTARNVPIPLREKVREGHLQGECTN